MGKYAICVRNVGKQYTIGAYQGRYKSLRDSLTNAVKTPFRRFLKSAAEEKEAHTIWALKGVSFDVEHGEVVGIIGRNGSGKSTLLKIMARITAPTTGELRIRGRVGSLLEVGTGFHPELTGRENIFLNGAILGMSRREIEHKFDEIVDFAEIEKFIDTPAKHYSSGMYMRLAFAVAAHLEPEILLVDEVLAVGDAQFQKKCLGKMGDVAKQGRTVLFVSHNMASMKQLCQNGILLSSGMIDYLGSIDEVISRYLCSRAGDTPFIDLSGYQSAYGNNELQVISLELLNSAQNSFSINFDTPIILKTDIYTNQDISNISFDFGVQSAENYPLFTVRSTDTRIINLIKGKHYKVITTIKHNLRAGLYNLILGISSGNYNYYYHPLAAQLEILEVGEKEYLYRNNGIINCESAWEISS